MVELASCKNKGEIANKKKKKHWNSSFLPNTRAQIFNYDLLNQLTFAIPHKQDFFKGTKKKKKKKMQPKNLFDDNTFPKTVFPSPLIQPQSSRHPSQIPVSEKEKPIKNCQKRSRLDSKIIHSPSRLILWQSDNQIILLTHPINTDIKIRPRKRGTIHIYIYI